jgi:hypothetical protein
METLKPARVVIRKVRIETVGEGNKANDKAVFSVKHPDRDDLVEISSVKYERKGNLKVSGLWYKEDEDSLISKSTALAVLLQFLKVDCLLDAVDKEIMTAEDEKGYLCFKAY